MDASTGINEQDAGLFFQDAYDNPGMVETNLGDGWTGTPWTSKQRTARGSTRL